PGALLADRRRESGAAAGRADGAHRAPPADPPAAAGLIMSDLGVRLQLLIGPTIPLPASYALVDSLDSLEVTNQDHERDGFQMTFKLGKDSLLEYGLPMSTARDPPAR